MSVKVSAFIWDGCAAEGIKGNKLLIMARLADYASDEGIAFPGIDTIARQIGAGRSTVITLIGELARDGWLTKTERRKGQRNTSNLYTLNVEKLRKAAAKYYSDSPESEHSEPERSDSGRTKPERSEKPKKASSHRPEIGPDPSVNTTTDPSDIKTSCPVAAQPDPAVVITDQAKQVLSHLNKTTGSRYQVCKSSLENIRARLAEGFTPDELMLVVDYSVEKWAEDLKMSEYLRPATLFIPSKFPGYLQSATRWDAAGRPNRKEWGRKRQHDPMKFGPVDTKIPEGFRG